jgi:Mce-associated membrane protein
VTTNDTADVTDADETEKVTDESVDEADEAIENDDAATETETRSEPRDGVVRRSARMVRSRLGAVLLAAVLVASAGVAAWLYFEQYRPDQETNTAAASVALDAAKNGTVALLSYSPESLDKDFEAAKSHLTGDFLSYYTQFTEQIVTPAAKQKSVKTSAAVVRARRGVRTASGLRGGAGVHQPDHHQQGESRRLVRSERGQGGPEKDQRHLADLVVRPRVASAPWRSRSLRTSCCRAAASRASVW